MKLMSLLPKQIRAQPSHIFETWLEAVAPCPTSVSYFMNEALNVWMAILCIVYCWIGQDSIIFNPTLLKESAMRVKWRFKTASIHSALLTLKAIPFLAQLHRGNSSREHSSKKMVCSPGAIRKNICVHPQKDYMLQNHASDWLWTISHQPLLKNEEWFEFWHFTSCFLANLRIWVQIALQGA